MKEKKMGLLRKYSYGYGQIYFVEEWDTKFFYSFFSFPNTELYPKKQRSTALQSVKLANNGVSPMKA